MSWDDVRDFLGGAAPVVGTLLGGSAGGAVGELVAKALGVEEKPDAVIDALKANPDAIVKIKELENSKALAEIQAATQSKQMDIDLEKGYIQDRSSAREREARVNESANASWLSKNSSSLIALTFVLVYLMLNTALLFNMAKPDASTSTMVISNLTNIIMLIVGYYFGSSKDFKQITPK